MPTLLERLGLTFPLIQAPMAGTATPAMAAAVTNAGALGSIGVGAANAATARPMIEALRAATNGPFNVNVFCHQPAIANPELERAWLAALEASFRHLNAASPPALSELYTSFSADTEMQELLLQMQPAVVSFHFGLPPGSVIGRLKAAGIVLFSSATNLAEAQQAVSAGVDAIVAQGYEAGGHRGVFDPEAPDARLGTLALTRLLVSKIPLPVIAAGGIMDGAGIAAVLALGAQAAQLGTAFIACPESAADDYYRAALFSPQADNTEMTPLISGRLARCLPNKFTALKDNALKGLVPPSYPIAYDAAKALAQAAKSAGEGGYGAQWAGQGAPLARAMPAAALIATLKQELQAAGSRVWYEPDSLASLQQDTGLL